MTQQRNDSDSIEMKILLREVKRSLTAAAAAAACVSRACVIVISILKDSNITDNFNFKNGIKTFFDESKTLMRE